MNREMTAFVNFSLRPASPKPLWSSKIGMAIVLICEGTEVPRNEYTHPSIWMIHRKAAAVGRTALHRIFADVLGR
jgi:hypothetical protein